MSFNFVIENFTMGGESPDLSPNFIFYKRGFRLGGSSGSDWRDIILHGNTALTLVNSKADGLNYLKLFGDTEQLPETYIDSVTLDGKCEQNGTPTPTVPVDIVCNNGTISFPQSAVGTVTQSGTPTPDNPVEPVFYQKGDLVLRAIDVNTDTYDASTQTITRKIGYHIFDGTETFGTSTAYGRALYINGASSIWGGGDRSKDVLCQYFTGTSSPSSSMPENTCFFNASGHFYFRTNESSTDFKAWLAELYANGTPLIVWFVKMTSETESYTPSIYIDGTTETATDSLGNTATAQMLLSVGNYKDTQEVLTGAVTRNVGIKVLDGTEEWSLISGAFASVLANIAMPISFNNTIISNTHFKGVIASTAVAGMPDLSSKISTSSGLGDKYALFVKYNAMATTTDFKSFLADQYNAGTPVIVVYPLATATTESVSGQFLSKSPVTYSGSITDLTGTVVESSHTTPTPTQPLPINCNNGVLKVNSQGQIYTDGTVETVEIDTTGNTATAEMLLKVGDYQDVQSVLDGVVTRNIGIKVFDGTEPFSEMTTTPSAFRFYFSSVSRGAAGISPICSHYQTTVAAQSVSNMPDMSIKGHANTANTYYIKDSRFNTADELKAWLAQQYNAGTPVIEVYALEEPTTETVTGQPLTIQAGTNVVEITQASMDDLELEVSYKAGVSVTVTEIENAQLDNSVEVTVNG